MLIPIVLSAFAVMCVSLIGVITIWGGIGKFVERNLAYLVSFASGIFIVLFLHLAEEVIQVASSPLEALFWILAGVILTSLVVMLVPQVHHHHADDDHHEHTKLDARRMLVADSAHNIGDGVLIAASYLISFPLGLATSVSLLMHELVQEVSEFFVLKQAGYSTRSALKINLMTASTILIGAIGGYFLLSTFSALELPILALAAGSLLAFLLQDLVPHTFSEARIPNCFWWHIAAVLLGVAVMFILVETMGHVGELH